MGEKEKEQKVASQEIEKGDSLDDKIFKIVSIVVQWYLVLEQVKSLNKGILISINYCLCEFYTHFSRSGLSGQLNPISLEAR